MAFPYFLTASSSSLQDINPFSIPPNSPAIDPTVADVLVVKAILQSLSLPLELADTIIDYAEYWPHTSAVLPSVNPACAQGNSHENYFVTRTLPLGCLASSPSTDPSRAPPPARPGNMRPHVFLPTQSEASKAATAALYSAWAQKSQPREVHPCRKIVFKFRMRDQGWGGEYKDHGTYNGSFTWLDVGRERARVIDKYESAALEGSTELPQPTRQRKEGSESDVEKTLAWNLESVDPPLKKNGAPTRNQAWLDPGNMAAAVELEHPFLPHGKTLQKNVTATKEAKDYTIVWRWDDDIDAESDEAEELQKAGRGKATGNGEFVRSLEVGDVVTVWARARFPGWSITVKDVEVDMFWAV
ncbi:hypothetical protein VC83_02874 [Pseudogymnoascus destructans]|uniref:Uncharacterized protein n=2 Tax=Pseudogymnoascus destructans TaxID=655981 RepID=L8FVI9_PSED2|nr:uncharacterized protein VC83_02874 [Pseudogymnoascus destructans]ELR04985.1 hypothetical protein GMDG_00242 [Pseudogymnoascus destructans 20631-21]OAF60090.1 hypothetical protein VC83_02874 [Pseudogymnoascus destructans]